MLQSSEASLSSLAPLHIIRSKRRTLSLEVRSNLELWVRVPSFTSDKEVLTWIKSRKAWIARARDEVRQRCQRSHALGQGQLPWQGGFYPFDVAEDLPQRFVFTGERFFIHTLWRHEADEVVPCWFQTEAQTILQKRLALLSERFDIAHQGFRLGRARTRWGSCSRSGLITLNWKLLWVKPSVLDYVITHELCHLRHFDHSAQFWNAVEELCPDYRESWDWLRQNAGLLTLQRFSTSSSQGMKE